MTKPRAYFRVAKLEDYQHYKDRRPAWVKLHRHVLESYDFGCLQDASKWLALGTILLASESGNRIPWDEEWVKNRLQMTTLPNFNDLLSIGFIELCDGASNLLAECSVSASPETEKEKEKEREKKLHRAAHAAPPDVVSDYTAEWGAIRALYPKREGAQGWPVAKERYVAHRKAGVSYEEVRRGVQAYAALMDKTGKTGTTLVAQAQTFFGPQRRWEEEYAAAPSAPTAADLEYAKIAAEAADVGRMVA